MGSKTAAAGAALVVCCMLLGTVTAQTSGSSRTLLQAQTVGASGTYDVQPFNSIVACVPFTVLVAPSAKANKYSVSTSYSRPVAASIVYKVQAKTLYIDISKDFETTEPVKVTVSLPANKLAAVTSTGTADIVVNRGFKTAATTISNQGTGNVAVRGMATQQLSIFNTGTGSIFAGGRLAAVALKVSGTGQVILSGAGKVTGTVAGTGNLYVNSLNGASAVNVNAVGINTIYYTKGTCTLGGMGGISRCAPSTAASFPVYSAEWTCGIHVEGAQACSANAVPPGGVQARKARNLLNGVMNIGSVTTRVQCTAPAAKLVIP